KKKLVTFYLNGPIFNNILIPQCTVFQDSFLGFKIAIIGAGSTYTPELIDGFIKRKNELPVT
ncbi:unnamed protein product, partial [marine sediment metagenome]